MKPSKGAIKRSESDNKRVGDYRLFSFNNLYSQSTLAFKKIRRFSIRHYQSNFYSICTEKGEESISENDKKNQKKSKNQIVRCCSLPL